MARPGLRAFRHRDYRVYYAGHLVALSGTWMQNVAQSWLVLQLTNSPLRLGLIGTLQFAPFLLLSVLAGVVADRLPRRRLLLATQATQAGLALAMAALIATGQVRYWQVAAMALLWGTASALDQPVRQTFVVELVGRDDLVSAVGLNSAAFNAARIVGPAAAGLLIAGAGIAPAFALNGLAFCASIATLLRVAVPGPAPRRAPTTVLQDVGEAVAFAVRTVELRLVLALVVTVSFCVFNFTVYVPLLARQVLGLGSEGFGFLMTAVGLGSLTAGLLLGAFAAGRPPLGGLMAALAAACAALVGLSLAGRFWAAAALLALAGFMATLASAGLTTWAQLLAPDALRGRMMSLYTLLSAGVFPFGAFWAGFVSEARGVTTTLLINGLLGLTAVAALAPWWLAGRRRRDPRDSG